MDTSQNTGKKRTTLIVALVACLVLAVGAGVFAWFSAQDKVVNEFTSGDGITDPEYKPVDPSPDKPDPVDPDPNKPTNPDTDGKIFEDKWVDKSAIAADSSVAKNPNIGIGKTSAPAYVFAEVENAVGNGTYFILNDNWKPVDGAAGKYDGAQGWAAIHSGDQAAQGKAYTGGLFMYVGKGGSDMAVLTPQPDLGAYTGELFSRVYAGDKASIDKGAPKMTVKAYLAAASNKTENLTDPEVKAEILASAKKWVTTNDN